MCVSATNKSTCSVKLTFTQPHVVPTWSRDSSVKAYPHRAGMPRMSTATWPSCLECRRANRRAWHYCCACRTPGVPCNRTPGASPGLPTNSIPADSRAVRIADNVCVLADGTPLAASIRFIVRTDTSASLDKSSIVHFKAARAARICSLIIIDTMPKWHYKCHIVYLR